MKNFFTSMLGALAALIVFTVGGAVLFVGFIAALAAMGGEKKVPVASGSYLVLDLSSAITDAPPVFDFRLSADRTPTLQLRTVTRTLRAAATDERIAGVFIKGDIPPAGFGPGYATLKEVRAALERFKESGKPVKGYLTYATTKNYYLASAADELTLDPYGLILMPGLSTQPMFLANAFEKYGIGVQVTRVGKYKSAIEPFTRENMSPESREQMQKLLDDLWTELVGDMAGARQLDATQVQTAVDSEGIIHPQAALEAKLVDRVAYRDEVIDGMRELTGDADDGETFKQITIADYSKIAKDILPAPAKVEGQESSGSGKVAVVYAEGDLVDGEGEEPGEIGGTRFARELRELRQDDSVSAIVLRVNSPGGTASASEAIQREVRLATAVKPVIVSMGSYAASGGYWISTHGDRIFAEPTTITGSIGVFGVQFDVKKLANDFGLTFDVVKTGKLADMLTVTRPKTPEEMAVFQRLVDRIYGEFIDRVVDGRGLEREFVEEIAQGRVWSGTEAKNLGLVDEIGGLDAAIKHAAGAAGLKSYRLVEYPRKKEFAEALQEALERYMPNSARAQGLAGQVAQRIEQEVKVLRTFNDARGLYARLPLNLNVE